VLRGVPVQELSDARNATVPMKRGATPAEMAGSIWFLLSPDSSYMTGEAMNVSGGLAMW
jgi:NAD(P)-dependent dehydrogenase (short-subunit alcohol dehydrogenase family)